jgi:hypothetical protein
MSRRQTVFQRLLASRVVIITMLTLLCIGAGVLTALHWSSVARAFSLATTHQPERYTQLYFGNSAHLPLYSPAKKIERPSFYIVNHEAHTVTYQYRVTFTVGTKTTTLRQASVVLADGQSVGISFSYTMPAPNLAAQISVQLAGRAEHINVKVKS